MAAFDRASRMSFSSGGGPIAAAMASKEDLGSLATSTASDSNDSDKPTFQVRVSSCRASKIPKRSLFSSAEPYLVFTFDTRTLTAPVSEPSTEPSWPSWQETFSYSVGSLNLLHEKYLTIECFDSKGRDDLFIGSATIDLWTIATGPSHQVHVLQEKKPSKKRPKLYFNVEMTLYMPVSISLANLMCIGLPPVSGQTTPPPSSGGQGGEHADAWMNDTYVSANIKTGGSSSGISAQAKRSYVRFDSFDPLWAEPDLSWVFLTSLRDLFNSTLILEVYNMNSTSDPTFIGGAAVPFSSCYSLEDGVPAIFRAPLSNRSRDLGPLMGSAQIEGQLYFAGLPPVSQMIGGSLNQGQVASAQPLLASLPRPACASLGDSTPSVQPYDPAVLLPPRSQPSPYFRFVDVVPLLHSGIETILQEWRRSGIELLTDKRLELGGCTLQQRLRYANFDLPLDFSLTRGLGALVCLLRASPRMEIRSERLHLMQQCARLLCEVVTQDAQRSQELVRTVGGVSVILGLLSQYRIGSENLSYFCQILNRLSTRDSANQLAMRKGGGIPILVSVLQSSHTALADKSMVVKILRNLCYLGEPGDEEGSSHVVRYSGGLKVLAELLMVSKHTKKTALMKVFNAAETGATSLSEDVIADSNSSGNAAGSGGSRDGGASASGSGSGSGDDEKEQFELVNQTIRTLEIVLSSEENLRSIEPLCKDLLLYGWFPHVQSFCLTQLSRLQTLLERPATTTATSAASSSSSNNNNISTSFGSVVLNIGIAPFLQVVSRASQGTSKDERLASAVKDQALGILGQIMAPGSSLLTRQSKEIRVENFLPLLSSGEERIVALAVDILIGMASLRKHVIAMCSHGVIDTALPNLVDLGTISTVSFKTIFKMAQLLEQIARHEGTSTYFASIVDYLIFLVLNIDATVKANRSFYDVNPGDVARLRAVLVALLGHVYPKAAGTNDETATLRFGQTLDICAELCQSLESRNLAEQEAIPIVLDLVLHLCEGSTPHSKLLKRMVVEHSDLASTLLTAALLPDSPSSGPATVLLHEICGGGKDDLDSLIIPIFQKRLGVQETTGWRTGNVRAGNQTVDSRLVDFLDKLNFAYDQSAKTVSRKQRSKQTIALMPTAGLQDSAAGGDEDEDRDCLVCMDAEADTVFYPCGHMTTCWDCSQDIAGSSKPVCPVCRQDIQRPVKAYFS